MKHPNTVETALRDLEAAPLGAAGYGTLLKAAQAAIADMEASARDQLFVPVAGVGQDAIAEFRFITDLASRATLDQCILEMHAYALAHNIEPMSRLIRSRAVLVMTDAALSFAISTDMRSTRVSAFVREIAGQLLASSKGGDDAPPAASLLAALPELEDRVAVVTAKHAAHDERLREDEERARIARAENARASRRTAVEDLRTWFGSRGGALFMYRNNPMTGGQYVFEVLTGDDAAAIPAWRVRHAIAARKTHEPDYQCPAWQREWTSAEWHAYRDAIADLSSRLERISGQVFVWGGPGVEPITGSDFAKAALVFEDDRQGVKPSSVRRCIEALRRFDKDYVWRGPTYSWFEFDEEADAGLEAFDRVDRHAQHLKDVAQATADTMSFHKNYDEKLRVIEGAQ